MKKGSYTLEAAIWIPFLMFIYWGSIQGGLSLYQEISKQELSRNLEAFWAVDTFYLENGWKEIINE